MAYHAAALSLRSIDTETCYSEYLSSPEALRYGIDEALRAALATMARQGIAVSLQEPAEELAAALYHHQQRAQSFNDVGLWAVRVAPVCSCEGTLCDGHESCDGDYVDG